MRLPPHEEAAALAQTLPQLSAATQFELALLLLEELELDVADLARLHDQYPRDL